MKKAILFLLATACTVCLFVGCSTDTAQSTVSQETVSEAVSSDTTVSEPESMPEEAPEEQESSAAPLEEAPAEETTTQTAAAQPNSSYNAQTYTPQTTADPYADWVPYHTSSPTTLAEAMANGYVVYHNGQCLASPYYFKMVSNQKVVYFKDISSEEIIDRFATANQSISDYHLNPEQSSDYGTLTGITSARPQED